MRSHVKSIQEVVRLFVGGSGGVEPLISFMPADEAENAFSAPEAVHIWHISLDVASNRLVDRLRTRLSADELERAERLASPEDRRRFVVGRGLLRRILGRYLKRPARSLEFRSGPYGKPELGASCGDGDVQFSTARRNGMAVIAVTSRQPIGVDLEFMDYRIDVNAIARRCFSRSEAAAIAGAEARQGFEAFFRLWTRMEAVLKLHGVGLAALDGDVPQMTFDKLQARSLVRNFDVAPSFMAALAIPRAYETTGGSK